MIHEALVAITSDDAKPWLSACRCGWRGDAWPTKLDAHLLADIHVRTATK